MTRPSRAHLQSHTFHGLWKNEARLTIEEKKTKTPEEKSKLQFFKPRQKLKIEPFSLMLNEIQPGIYRIQVKNPDDGRFVFSNALVIPKDWQEKIESDIADLALKVKYSKRRGAIQGTLQNRGRRTVMLQPALEIQRWQPQGEWKKFGDLWLKDKKKTYLVKLKPWRRIRLEPWHFLLRGQISNLPEFRPAEDLPGGIYRVTAFAADGTGVDSAEFRVPKKWRSRLRSKLDGLDVRLSRKAHFLNVTFTNYSNKPRKLFPFLEIERRLPAGWKKEKEQIAIDLKLDPLVEKKPEEFFELQPEAEIKTNPPWSFKTRSQYPYEPVSLKPLFGWVRILVWSSDQKSFLISNEIFLPEKMPLPAKKKPRPDFEVEIHAYNASNEIVAGSVRNASKETIRVKPEVELQYHGGSGWETISLREFPSEKSELKPGKGIATGPWPVYYLKEPGLAQIRGGRYRIKVQQENLDQSFYSNELVLPETLRRLGDSHW